MKGKKDRKKRKSFHVMLLSKNFERERKKTHHYKNHTQSSQVRNTDKIHENLRHINMKRYISSWGFPGGSVLKNPPPNAEDTY